MIRRIRIRDPKHWIITLTVAHHKCRFSSMGAIFTYTVPVLWIRIVMDPELLPGSEIIVPDPDPAKYERADK